MSDSQKQNHWRVYPPGPWPRPGDEPQNHTPDFLGIELPFGWCLVKGERLRKLQAELRQARFDAAVRSRMCANLLPDKYHRDRRRKDS